MTASTRLAYVLLFFGGQVTSWVLRDFAKPLLAKLPWIVRVYAGQPPDSWFGEQAVLRVALGNALFFAALAGLTAGVQTNADTRYRCAPRRPPSVRPCVRALSLAVAARHGERSVRPGRGRVHTERGGDSRPNHNAPVGLPRHVHKGHWVLKTLAWALLMVLPFLLPNSLVAAFGARGCGARACACAAVTGSPQ